jgi:DNA-binding HxlR family transcriptional regulator
MQEGTSLVPGIQEDTGSEPTAPASTAPLRGKKLRSGCPVEATLACIGGRWKGVILYRLLVGGKHRFSELRRRFPGCTQRILTLQLRELEADGFVNRILTSAVPPRVEYELTEFGRTLEPILLAIREWGSHHIPPPHLPCPETLALTARAQ